MKYLQNHSDLISIISLFATIIIAVASQFDDNIKRKYNYKIALIILSLFTILTTFIDNNVSSERQLLILKKTDTIKTLNNSISSTILKSQHDIKEIDSTLKVLYGLSIKKDYTGRFRILDTRPSKIETQFYMPKPLINGGNNQFGNGNTQNN